MNKFKNCKGITLVALIITIIILLILAGIAIAQLQNNGLFGKSQQAKGKWENAQVEEELELGRTANKIDILSSRTETDEIALLKEEVRVLKEKVAALSNHTWELIDSTTSTSFVKSTKDIDNYNYVAVSVSGFVNSSVISVDSLKSTFNSSSKTFRVQWTSGEYAEIYYNDGLYMKKTGTYTANCTVYGLK